MISVPARSRSMKTEAMVRKSTHRGNNEKSALKANAPAHCAPSIPRNLLTASLTISQTRRVCRPSLPGPRTGAAGRGRMALGSMIETCLCDGCFTPGFPGNRFIDPVSLTIVMPMQSGLIIPSEQRLLRVFWGLLDGLAGKIDADLRLVPTLLSADERRAIQWSRIEHHHKKPSLY